MPATLATVMLELLAEPIAPTKARHALKPLGEHLAKEKYEDVALLVSELVAWAVTRTATPAVLVRVSVNPGCVRGQVTTAMGPDAMIRVPDSEAEVLGRRILDSVATRWSSNKTGTETWFEIAC